MNHNVLIFCLIPGLSFLVCGCGNNVVDQLSIDMSKDILQNLKMGNLMGIGYMAMMHHIFMPQ